MRTTSPSRGCTRWNLWIGSALCVCGGAGHPTLSNHIFLSFNANRAASSRARSLHPSVHPSLHRTVDHSKHKRANDVETRHAYKDDRFPNEGKRIKQSDNMFACTEMITMCLQSAKHEHKRKQEQEKIQNQGIAIFQDVSITVYTFKALNRGLLGLATDSLCV